jgi:prepilin-type N-terminal cleavage/methylation domain-containing protein
MAKISNTPAGFTLLEVMVALTITGMALGGLFSVIAGNKRLAWNSEQALVRSMHVRSLINFSQLNNARGEIAVDFVNPEFSLRTELEIETPPRKTMATLQALEAYDVVDATGEVVAQGSYWVELDLPR